MYSIIFKNTEEARPWFRSLISFGYYRTIYEARDEFTKLRQTLGADIAPGDELKCQVEINGKKFNIYIAGLLGTPIKYTDFTECL